MRQRERRGKKRAKRIGARWRGREGRRMWRGGNKRKEGKTMTAKHRECPFALPATTEMGIEERGRSRREGDAKRTADSRQCFVLRPGSRPPRHATPPAFPLLHFILERGPCCFRNCIRGKVLPPSVAHAVSSVDHACKYILRFEITLKSELLLPFAGAGLRSVGWTSFQ